MKLNSKYSGLNIAEAGALELDCYEDKLIFGKHGNVSVKAKYTVLNLSDFDQGSFAIYETTVNAGIAEKLTVTAKYSTLEFQSVIEADFPDVYETKVTCNFIGKMGAVSKYSTFRFSYLETSLVMNDSYEDNIFIERLSSKFKNVYLASKYSDLDIAFEPGSLYKIDADLTYTSLEYPSENFREIRYHKDGEKFLYQGVIKGANETTSSVVTLKMYEGSAELR